MSDMRVYCILDLEGEANDRLATQSAQLPVPVLCNAGEGWTMWFAPGQGLPV